MESQKVDFMLQSGEQLLQPTCPVFPWLRFRGRAGLRLISLCLWRSKLWYRVRAEQRPRPSLPYRPVGSGVTQSISDFLVLRLDSESRQV